MAWLLDRLLPDGDHRAPLGDFEEIWHHIKDERGTLRAHAWYILAVLGLIPRRIYNSIYFGLLMLQNYLKTSWRNMLRNRTWSAVNLLSLTLGTACFLLIAIYVHEESTFDAFHTDADRIYRVNVDFIGQSYTFANALSAAPMGPAIQTTASGVDHAVRISQVRPEVLLQVGSMRDFEENGFYADSTLFHVFSFEMLEGDPGSALVAPQSVVLTASTARKYFGRKNPLGEFVRMDNTTDLTVTGVVQDPPTNSHFRFDFLISFSSLNPERLTNWFSNPYYTFLKLSPNKSEASLRPVLARLVDDNMAADAASAGVSIRLWLQPLLDIRMNPQGNDLSDGRGAGHVFILSGIALFILFLACINFVNLATARSSTRAKEVGMRKVIGASRGQLMGQVLGESGLLGLIACLAGVASARAALPWFESLVGRTVAFPFGWELTLFILGLAILVSLLSGIVPAIQLSRLQPIGILKGNGGQSALRGAAFRNALVVFQFTVSVALIVVTIMVYRQVGYMKSIEHGISTDQIAVIPVNEPQVAAIPTLKEQFLRLPGVEAVTWANRAPGTGASGNLIRRLDTGEDDSMENKYIFADASYLDVLGASMVAGRYFEPHPAPAAPSLGSPMATDVRRQFILNETSVRMLGWASPEEAIGQPLEFGGSVLGDVIGVMADFQFQPLTVSMQPVIFQYAPAGQGVLMVRVRTDRLPESLASLEDVWNAQQPDWPFMVTFLDDEFDALYASEEQFGRMFSTFAILAVVIACLGLFGLATFSVQRRRREIAIRKALGATDGGVVLLISRKFGLLILVANVLAWPLAWVFVKDWQQAFAVQASMTLWVFLGAGAISLLIAALAVSTQSIQASRTRPAEALRVE